MYLAELYLGSIACAALIFTLFVLADLIYEELTK